MLLSLDHRFLDVCDSNRCLYLQMHVMAVFDLEQNNVRPLKNMAGPDLDWQMRGGSRHKIARCSDLLSPLTTTASPLPTALHAFDWLLVNRTLRKFRNSEVEVSELSLRIMKI